MQSDSTSSGGSAVLLRVRVETTTWDERGVDWLVCQSLSLVGEDKDLEGLSVEGRPEVIGEQGLQVEPLADGLGLFITT